MSSNDPTTVVPLPSVAGHFLQSMAQNVGVAAGTWLVAHQLLSQSQSADATSAIAGAIVLTGTVLWNYARARIAASRAKALANAPAVKPPL